MNPLLVFARSALLTDASRTPEATGIEEVRVRVKPACCCVGLESKVLVLAPKVNRVSKYNPGAYPFQNNNGPKHRTLTPFTCRAK